MFPDVVKRLLGLILATLVAGVGVIAYGGNELIEAEQARNATLARMACIQEAEARTPVTTRVFSKVKGYGGIGGGPLFGDDDHIDTDVEGDSDRRAAVFDC